MEASTVAGRGMGSQKYAAMVIGNQEFEFSNNSVAWSVHHFFGIEGFSE